MKIVRLGPLILVGVLAGCVANDMYYWGRYEQTLYEYRKAPNEANLAKHKKQLEKIISTAEFKHRPVPPGIYFELGMIEAQTGNVQRSIELLNREKQAFPEARVYVDNAIARLGSS